MIYKVLRIGNPLWLLWSMVTVECTLNFNHIQSVLGGPENDLSNPGQLLPFLVGAFGFVQTVYGILKERVFQKDFHAAPEAYGGQFGPSVLRSTTDMDKIEQAESRFRRYLVGWLPWLSLLHSYDEKLARQGISRSNTGLDSLPATPGLPLYSPSSVRSPGSVGISRFDSGFSHMSASRYMSGTHEYKPAAQFDATMSPRQ